MIQILVTDSYQPEALTQLQTGLKCHISKSSERYPSEDELKSTNALLIRSRTRIDEKLLERAPELKLIVSATSGLDHIDLDLCESRKVQVHHTTDANTQSAAETALLLTLQVLKKQRQSQLQLDQNQWKDGLTKGNELSNKEVGLVGLGRVGSRVAAMMQAFGARVYACDPYREDEYFQERNVERLGLSELLRQVQILSLHVPLTDETQHMINLRNLPLLSSESTLINTSRGAVINEGDLTVALEQKIIAGAGLDVFEVEPLSKESRLRNLPQAVLSPHLGAFTEEAFSRASNMAVQKVIKFFTN